MRRRDGMIRDMSREFGLSTPVSTSGELSQERLLSFNSAIQNKETELTAAYQREKTSYESQEADYQTQLDELNQRKTQLETSCQVNQNTRSENKRKIRDINSKLCEVDGSSGRLDTLNLEIRRTVSCS